MTTRRPTTTRPTATRAAGCSLKAIVDSNVILSGEDPRKIISEIDCVLRAMMAVRDMSRPFAGYRSGHACKAALLGFRVSVLEPAIARQGR